MKIAFVCPRYGIDAAGGAAIHVEWLAQHVKDAGFDVEVLTTCAKDHFGWENYYPEGEEDVEGIRVRKFKVDERNTITFLKIQNRIIAGERVLYEDQLTWAKESVNSDSMYRYIERESGDYDYFIFIPYMFGTTINGSKVCPDKSILIPTLHDEIYAYLEIFKEMFQRFRGIMFSTPPEMELGRRLYELGDEKTALVALGFDGRKEASPERFRTRYELRDDFCLYAGRREGGKNTPLLVDYFNMYKRYNESNLKLVLIGSGEVSIPDGCEEDIVDLGYVSVEDKYDAHAAAAFLCQPSINESLSIAMMESWLAGVPVLVHDGCAVTRFHSRKSNGGLYFGNYFEFEECLNFFSSNPGLGCRMGANGKRYVEENYSWDKVVERFKSALEKFD
jgi:glycosyltransferase involved in cell wall biosynthesis